ncbi:hypothetical protein O181_032783 [Austropuccinia psidii MF-1]|uniref:Uncharacterized protein n=1 Tax=Austropuccinia psidii MF-1 TaxID=1389203 RepID=A0A9Q3D063_9BASI|nr:hypothetical protein [Austropuccinia psidii MF-1]
MDPSTAQSQNDGSTADSSNRRLRTRTRKSYALSEFTFNELDSTDYSLRESSNANPKLSFPSSFHQHSNHDPMSIPLKLKPVNRISISRELRVPSPPPLVQSVGFKYIQTSSFPAWLLGDALAKSSPNYLKQACHDDSRSAHASPVRLAGSTILGASPAKSVYGSLSRQSSTIDINLPAHGRSNRSLSIDEEYERRQEKFWEQYEYDPCGPHLQPRYFDKPLPVGEQWCDLDIQNPGIISEPTLGSHPVNLLEVHFPASNEQTRQHCLQQRQIEKMKLVPFGFNFLPDDYTGHKPRGGSQN